jgi:hypothetical protein
MESEREFPSAGEWQAIFAASPFPALLALASGCGPRPIRRTRSRIGALAVEVDLARLDVELYNRVVDVGKSYVFMKYYHSLGIPDERWYISPGRAGQSVEYFPDFQNEHFVIKGWFDYYVDTFYQKLFAAWAVVGHVLNQTFSLGLKPKQIDFEPAVKALGPSDTDVRAALMSVLEHAAFVHARALRNDITHNESPSAVGMTVSKSKTVKAVVYKMGMKSYVPSMTVLENASESVVLLRRTVEAICPPAT